MNLGRQPSPPQDGGRPGLADEGVFEMEYRGRLWQRAKRYAAMAGITATLAMAPGSVGAIHMEENPPVAQAARYEASPFRSVESLIEGLNRPEEFSPDSMEMSDDERRVERLAERLRRSTVMIESDDSIGSGVIIRRTEAETIILTNRHVVMSGDDQTSSANIVVRNNGKEARPFGILVAPHGLDLALLVVNDNLGPPVRIARREPRQGSSVLVMGAPLGVEDSVSRGIISNFRARLTGTGFEFDAIQTDAAINPGNSGGGMFLVSSGELVGIPAFKPLLNPITPADSIGYALPARVLARIPAREWQMVPVTVSDPLPEAGTD